MARFTKYNNPSRRRRPSRFNGHSQAWIDERREEMYRMLAQETTEEGRDAIIKAFQITVDPSHR